MGDRASNEPRTTGPRPGQGDEAREVRRALALRANLRRRKAAAQAAPAEACPSAPEDAS